MDARLVFILSVFTLGLWGHMTSAMQIRQELSEEEEEPKDEQNNKIDLHSIYKLEQFLYDVRDKLDRARQAFEADEYAAEPERSEYRLVSALKRKAPSGFYGVRGRRAQEMTSQDLVDQSRDQDDLLRLMDFYRTLHEKRVAAGDLTKRQPPVSGFHAVRGKRNARASSRN